jgi:hypothetical protein
MAYEIKSTLGGQTFTLNVSTAIEAIDPLEDLPTRGHQNLIVRDMNGSTINPNDLIARSVHERQNPDA